MFLSNSKQHKNHSQCLNCIEIQSDMLNAAEDPHYLLKPTYQKLNDMYKNHKLNLVIADCSFENFMEEVFEEKHYTYQAYLQCPKCKLFFHLGVCVRGTPIYKVSNCPPNITQFVEISKRRVGTFPPVDLLFSFVFTDTVTFSSTKVFHFLQPGH